MFGAAGTLGYLAGAGLAPRIGDARKPERTATDETLGHNARLLSDLRDLPADAGLPYDWVVVHHTAAESATLEGIDRYHHNHFGDPLGAEYHFVIGNGRREPMGRILAARWRHQAWAAHLFHPERAPASIAVCLIGNFHERELPAPMANSLVELLATVLARRDLPVARISEHRTVDRRLTACPGRHYMGIADDVRDRVARKMGPSLE